MCTFYLLYCNGILYGGLYRIFKIYSLLYCFILVMLCHNRRRTNVLVVLVTFRSPFKIKSLLLKENANFIVGPHILFGNLKTHRTGLSPFSLLPSKNAN